jgi:hypothetical protein
VVALIALSIALLAVIVSFAWLLDRRDARERAERAELLQRIQAPHAAVAEHHYRADPPETGSSLPMSDAEIADQERNGVPDTDAERQRWIAQVEAIENGTAQLLDGVLS